MTNIKVYKYEHEDTPIPGTHLYEMKTPCKHKETMIGSINCTGDGACECFVLINEEEKYVVCTPDVIYMTILDY